MEIYEEAAAYLSKHDPVLRPVIARAGLSTMRPHRNYYQALVTSIISQQLSVKAADTIERRFCELFGAATVPTPEQILTKDIDGLRSAGLSRGKAVYVRDLAQHVLDRSVRLDDFDGKSNETIIKELTAVKGIGEWTAHMFLMFCMGRLDVLAVGDLGIRNGIMKLYGLERAPSPDDIRDVARKNHWHPYESIACWYIWHSLDNKPAVNP
ncbi:MAG TPA: DNA-3-methyladenine glycosylase [Candidatus Saccharimonadales bacterium]|nr:DNA-3-methyladenine glycosylase [Candidatus Saccharimonadales bacterium]